MLQQDVMHKGELLGSRPELGLGVHGRQKSGVGQASEMGLDEGLTSGG